MVKKLDDALHLIEIKFLGVFFEIGGKVERFCLIWGIYARFSKNMADSSQLIISLILVTYLAIFNWQIRSFSLASSVLTSLQDSFPPALFCSEQWLVNIKLPILDVTRPELFEPRLEFCEYPEESSHEAFGPESKDGKARPEKIE